ELVRRLQEYERFKQAAEDLDKLPREERDIFTVQADGSLISVDKPLPVVFMPDLVRALADVLKRVELNTSHHIRMDALSVREKMSHILATIQDKEHFLF